MSTEDKPLGLQLRKPAVTLAMAQDLIGQFLTSADLDAKFLCRELGVSRSALFRLFENYGGVAIYIRHQRLKEVRSAITEQGDLVNFKELARYWHFSDQSHFSRAFRQAYGLTPTAYRKRKCNRA